MSGVVLPTDILQRVRSDFGESQASGVIRSLEAYAGPEPDRVRRCVLHLAAGASDKVAYFLDAATTDYRDVILWAEYDRDDRRVRDLSRTFE